MIKASALYIVIVIALVIALLCSSLIVAAYFYKTQYQEKFRYDQLTNNLGSGVNILLANNDSTYVNGKIFSLFNNNSDSVALQKLSWGIYDIGISKAFIQKDSLYKIFMMANTIDSSKWAALYLADQDRALSLSGETGITGNAFIPKVGVKKAYVNNKSYTGDDRLIAGNQSNSQKELPQLGPAMIGQLKSYLSEKHNNVTDLAKTDTIKNSFFHPTLSVDFGKKAQTIKSIVLSGNIILFSDTALTIDNSATLNNVLVFARSIRVKDGFHGSCQLFATDSIHVEPNCVFNYPSCIGVINSEGTSAKIEIDQSTQFNGLIFSYQETAGDHLPSIYFDKDVMINGQVYSQGILTYKENLNVQGSVFTRLFTYQNGFNLMENMLIDSKLSSKDLSPYYLTSELVPVAKKRKKVLQWLEGN